MHTRRHESRMHISAAVTCDDLVVVDYPSSRLLGFSPSDFANTPPSLQAMSLFRATGQFDDADDDSAAVAVEQNIAQATAASRFSAASRAAAMGFAPGAALARVAAERSATSGAAASYLSMLQNAAAADPNSPYFQRQAYRQTFITDRNFAFDTASSCSGRP